MGKNEIIYTGFTKLDKLTGGFKRGELVSIGARPSMGITAFALSIAENILKQDKKVSIFSLDLSIEHLVKRLMIIISGESFGKNYENLAKTVDVITKWNLYIDDTPDITPEQIEEKIKKVKPEVVFID